MSEIIQPNQAEVKYFEGCIEAHPKIYCLQHSQQVTHGCVFDGCDHPLVCGSCSDHQHKSVGPYASLQNIEQYLFTVAGRIRKTQDPLKDIWSSIVHNKDNQSLLQWQEDLEGHLKQIENYTDAQKELISIDIQEIGQKLLEVLDSQKVLMFRHLDEFTANYRRQFSEFKLYNEDVFQVLSQKYKYLCDPNCLCAKLNSLDAALSSNLISEISEVLESAEDLFALNGLDLNKSKVEAVFLNTNQLINKVPSYKQFADFELKPSNNVQSGAHQIRSIHQIGRYKLIEDIKENFQTHFKEATSNYFGEPLKIGIPREIIQKRNKKDQSGQTPHKSITYIHRSPSLKMQDQLNDSHASSRGMIFNNQSNSTGTINQNSNSPVNIAFQKRGSYEVPNQPQALQKQGSFFGELPASQRGASPISRIPLSNNGTKGKIFDNSKSQHNGQALNQTRNIYGSQQSTGVIGGNSPFSASGTSNTSATNYSASRPPTFYGQSSQVVNQYFVPKREFKLTNQSQPFPKFMCYLGGGYIAMAGQPGETLRVLDVLSSSIVEYRQLINREIKFVASIGNRSNMAYENNNFLLFAVSTVDSIIQIFQFNIKQRDIQLLNINIIGFSAQVSRIVDLSPITNSPLMATGDENGEISVFDYSTTKGYGLNKVHQSPIIQLLALPSYSQNQSSRSAKFISLGFDQVLVIYEKIGEANFVQWKVFNVSNVGGGISTLRAHPEFEQVFAITNNGSLRLLSWESSDLSHQEIHPQAARDLAIFFFKDYQIGTGSSLSNVSQLDPELSGLVILSEFESDKLLLFKTKFQNSTIQKEYPIQNSFSHRKVLYADSRYKLFIVINDFSHLVQAFDIKI